MKTIGVFLATGSCLRCLPPRPRTYTVTTTADTGPGSLRQAILDANANVGADTIAFNIVGSGVHTIAPASAAAADHGRRHDRRLHAAGVAAPNTNAPDQGTNAVLLIEIDGTNAGTGSDAAVLFFAPGSGGQRRPRPRHQPRHSTPASASRASPAW